MRSPQRERRSDVKQIHRAMSRFGRALGRETLCSCVDGGPVARRKSQHAIGDVLTDQLQVGGGGMAVDQFPKNRETDGIVKLKAIKARDWQRRTAGHVSGGRSRVNLLHVEAVEKAGIGVGAQYLPLFSARIARAAAEEMMRRPCTFFSRAAKSGILTAGFLALRSGTRRAITFRRIVILISWPSLIQVKRLAK